MAKCYNKSTVEYKALQKEYGHDLIVDSIIDSYHGAVGNKSDDVIGKDEDIPTVAQVKELIRDMDSVERLRNTRVANALVANFIVKGMIYSVDGSYFVHHTNVNTGNHSSVIMEHNINRIESFLKHHGISGDAVTAIVDRAQQTYKIEINEDHMPKSSLTTKTSTNALRLINHLSSVFPNVNVEIETAENLEDVYNIFASDKTVDFKDVKSFNYESTVYIVSDRVDDETAIEEMLHPFTAVLKVSNNRLYNTLVDEASETFKTLKKDVDATYTEEKGFTKEDRDMELITKALSKHFNKDFKSSKSRSWMEAINDFIRWFLDVVSDYKVQNFGRTLQVNAAKLKSGVTLSDLSRLLNTKDVEFDMSAKIPTKLNFSLTPETQSMVDHAKSTANEIQKNIIDNLFNVANKSEEHVTDLSTSTVILNRNDHTYVDLETGETYASTTSRIGGKFDDQGKYELSRDLGNDFDHMMNSIVEGKSFQSIAGDFKVMDQSTSKDAWESLSDFMDTMREDGHVFLAQVVVSDPITKLAGTIDILRIGPDGTLTIMDLKTSRHSHKSDDYENRMYPVNEGSVWYDASLLPEQQRKLTTEMKHSLQTNAYARMLENAGFTVSENAQTKHVLVDVENVESGQRFNQSFKLEGRVNHYRSENEDLLNNLVPSHINTTNRSKLENNRDERMHYIETEEFMSTEEMMADAAGISIDLFDELTIKLDKFAEGVGNKKRMYEESKSYNYLDKTTKEVVKDLTNIIDEITNTKESGGDISLLYTKFLEMSIDKINAYIAYATDIENHNKHEFINKIFAWKDLIENYRGLAELREIDGLTSKQGKLLNTLRSRLDQLIGVRSVDGKFVKTDGILDNAVKDYVKSITIKVSNYSFTEKELSELVTVAVDISGAAREVGDMATSSDRLLAVMDKIYKREEQIMLDTVSLRLERVNKSEEKLIKLSPNGKVDYDFMNVFDEDNNYMARYVKRIGKQYFDIMNKLMDELKDEHGNTLDYILFDDVTKATTEQIEYNKKLFLAKKAVRDFQSAEIRTSKGYADGEYHSFTKEFKDARSAYEVYKTTRTAGYWERRSGISDQEWNSYRNKYFTVITSYNKAVYENGEFTGHIIEGKNLRVVNREHVVERDTTSKGVKMTDPKWDKLQNPKTELDRARKEFYTEFVKMYEDELLATLPESINMVGRAPTVMSSVTDEFSNKPNMVGRIWSKMASTIESGPAHISNLFKRTINVEKVFVDEYGNVQEDSLPLFYVNTPVDKRNIVTLESKMLEAKEKLKKAKTNITYDKLNDEIAYLRSEINRIKTQPSSAEVNQDLAESLRLMIGMTTRFHLMSQSENVFKAFIQVISNRKTTSDSNKLLDRAASRGKKVGDFASEGYDKIKEKFTGRRNVSAASEASNIEIRAKAWMKMVFYDNDESTRNVMDKMASGLIQLSSATYVAFNIFGNLNNYVMGRMNNAIEMLGGLYVDPRSSARALAIFNGSVTQGVFTNMSNKFKKTGKLHMPNKALAFIDQYRMTDQKSDIRETTQATGRESLVQRLLNFGYIFQDAGEFNVQTKVGLAIIISSKAINSKTGKEISLYDAYDYDRTDGKLVLKKGYDKVRIFGRTKDMDANDDARYEVRNYIREVNKQIHGNYAHTDRMMIQRYALGKLAGQFHKWVAPAIKARFRKEYFDENLGWLEGRYISAVKYLKFSLTHINDFGNINSKFKEYHGDQGRMKLKNMQRVIMEIALFNAVYLVRSLLLGVFNDEDDDDKGYWQTKFENIVLYQADRLYKEQIAFFPLHFGAYEQQMQYMKSPIASTRTMGEVGQAMSYSMRTPLAYMYHAYRGTLDDEFYGNTSYYYTRGSKAGKLKLNKEWGDVVPIWYSAQKWRSFDERKSFYIK